MDNIKTKDLKINDSKMSDYNIDGREIIGALFDNIEFANKTKQSLKDIGFADEQIEVHYVNRTSKDGINLSLIGLGFPHDEALYFEKKYREDGKIIVIVRPKLRTEDAFELLIRNSGDVGLKINNTDESLKNNLEKMKNKINIQQQNFRQREIIGGIFTIPQDCFKAIDELKKLGFSNEHIRLYSANHDYAKEQLNLLEKGFTTIEAKYFEKAYQNGETLLTVSSTDRIDEVMEIITNNSGDIGFDAYEKNANDQNMHSFNDYDLGRD
ncbi:MAG: hypothetical protein H7263_13165 [Candidatus Sericytochromatia bacterium]|nr:hypothetical protein [Candidatus Sericytochromatia bacterium]